MSTTKTYRLMVKGDRIERPVACNLTFPEASAWMQYFLDTCPAKPVELGIAHYCIEEEGA